MLPMNINTASGKKAIYANVEAGKISDKKMKQIGIFKCHSFEKSAQRNANTARWLYGGAKKFRPAADPFPGGGERERRTAKI